MHRLLLFFTGLGAATLSAQNLPEAVQSLNIDAVRELVSQQKYTEKERVQANQAIVKLLQEKSKPTPFYKNFKAQAQLGLSLAVTYYVTKKVIESAKFIYHIDDDRAQHYARGDYNWRPPSPFTTIPHFMKAVYGGMFGIPLVLFFTGRSLQQFNHVSNPDYLNALAISSVLKTAKPGTV